MHNSIAIFGGTFDPIHNGHLNISAALQSYFNFDSYIFLPCKSPTLKTPALANSQQRIEMIRLAIKEYNFSLDLREIKRDTPSYTVETLESFRSEYPRASISLILGYDAFLSLPQWYEWKKLITLAHLLIINRSKFAKKPLPKAIKNLLETNLNSKSSSLVLEQAGSLFFFDAGHYDISSSSIRQDIKKRVNIKNLVPPLVYEYIKSQELYR